MCSFGGHPVWLTSFKLCPLVLQSWRFSKMKVTLVLYLFFSILKTPIISLLERLYLNVGNFNCRSLSLGLYVRCLPTPNKLKETKTTSGWQDSVACWSPSNVYCSWIDILNSSCRHFQTRSPTTYSCNPPPHQTCAWEPRTIQYNIRLLEAVRTQRRTIIEREKYVENESENVKMVHNE